MTRIEIMATKRFGEKMFDMGKTTIDLGDPGSSGIGAATS